MLFRAFRDVSWAYDEARNDYRRLADECREHLAIVEALLGRRRAGRGPGHVPAHPLGREILEPVAPADSWPAASPADAMKARK